MSDFNPEIMGIRLRLLAGLPCPPPHNMPPELFPKWEQLLQQARLANFREISAKPEQGDGR